MNSTAKKTIVTIPASEDLNFTEGFTLEAWVDPSEVHNWSSLIAKEDGSESPPFSYLLYGQGGGEMPVIYMAEDESELTHNDGETPLPTNTWSHLAVTSDGEHSRIYINGELDSVGPALPVKATSGPLQIGGNEVFGEHFAGRIDEVRLYGEVLDAGEIEEDRDTGLSPAPKNISTPGIFGVAEEARTLKADPGSWKGAGLISFTYQWERCEAKGPACESIAEADDKTYVLDSEDVGSRLRIQVTAGSNFGIVEAKSTESSVIATSKPWFEVSPAVKGSTTVGETLSADIDGLRGSSPLTTSYIWERCAEFCEAVSEAGGIYKLVSADAATQIRVKVSSENAKGDVTARSLPTVYISPSETGGPPDWPNRCC